MTLLAISSPRSSPGATSLGIGLAMAWQQWGLTPVFVEADPHGGVVAHRFGLATHTSLLSFASDSRRGFSEAALNANVQLAGETAVIVGPADPINATQAVERSADVIAQRLARPGRPVIADVGRLHIDSPALALVEQADQVILVLQPRADQVQAALFQMRFLRQLGAEVGLVIVGQRPHLPTEVASVLDARLLGVVPFDPQAAAPLNGGRYKRRAFRRTTLWRSISALGASLASDLALGDAAPQPVNSSQPVSASKPVESSQPPPPRVAAPVAAPTPAVEQPAGVPPLTVALSAEVTAPPAAVTSAPAPVRPVRPAPIKMVPTSMVSTSMDPELHAVVPAPPTMAEVDARVEQLTNDLDTDLTLILDTASTEISEPVPATGPNFEAPEDWLPMGVREALDQAPTNQNGAA